MKDSKSLIMQIKYLTNSLLILSKLKKQKPNLYKNDYCILYKEKISEDLDYLISCFVLQDSWKEIEEAIIKDISRFQTEENNSLDIILRIKELVFSENKKSKY